MHVRFSSKMSCLMGSGFNVECIKHREWMPVLKRNLYRSYSSIRKASKRKSKQNKVTEVLAPVSIEKQDSPEEEQVKHCEMCPEMRNKDGNIRETGDRTEKETQTPEVVRKPSYPKISDFLIRNIMSFPIHGSFTEEYYQTENSKFSSFPSVTTILNETVPPESKKWLEKWKQKMISEFGLEKFTEMQNATLSRGSKLHSAIKKYLLGNDVTNINVDENIEGCWESVMTALPHISNVKLVETRVYHPHLHYKGIVDCVACFKNVPHVIEWKQSEKAKKNLEDTYDAPIQLCAYMGTMSWCKTVDFTEPITNGLVVIAHVDGSPANIFQLNSEYCERYWAQWLRRVQQFWLIHSPELKDSLHP